MSSYIGYTPWKKLKKLFIITKGIIGEFGLKYFFYVVNLELKKQGFSIFTPDEKPVPLYSEKNFQEKYQLFLNKMNEEQSKTNYDLIYSPNLLFVLFANSKNFKDILLSISSLQTQLYQNWGASIFVTDEKIKENLVSEKLPSNVSLLQNFSIKNLVTKDYDYCAFLTPGTILHQHSIQEFIKYIDEQKQSDILYCDHDIIESTNTRSKPFFKPDWDLYLLRSLNYFSPFFIIKKNLIDRCIEPNISNCYAFDILLQCIEMTDNIFHISKPLISLSVKPKIDLECTQNSLSSHLVRMNIDAKVEKGISENTFRINYTITKKPKVSIIIPTKNNFKILSRCITSIEKKTHYKNWEIIIIDNSDETIKKDHSKLKNYLESSPYKILRYEENFNFSKMNNDAVKLSTGEILLFLNDDTKILDPYWLDELVSIILQKDVGVVGPKLTYSDNTIQHAGMVFLKTGSGFHPFMKEPENSSGYNNLLNVMREYSAVTGACLMTTRKIFDQVNGFDNQFDAYYGDSDLCLKIHKEGFRIVFTPFTKLLHEGSFSIAGSGASYFAVESHLDFINKWPSLTEGDPSYNANLGWNYDIDILD